ncbi:PH domain-containing protein [Phytohabitans kaempferiae]|uniref:PH domain-containing protein n=1 Tax=Phytohabitans kaempferiae TaxID=1620943 RepID=A0ABV6M7R7_9ACTN
MSERPAAETAVGGPVGGPGGAEPKQRLHPLTPLLKGARALVVIIAALSWQTLGSLGLGWFAAIVVAALIGYVVLSAVSWYFTGYQVVGRELRIHEGLVFRRTRAIPLERLQAVEVVRPLLAQLTGLAELRLEVVGGGKTEAPLAFLTVAESRALRERLLVLAGKASAAAHTEPVAGEAPAPHVPHERPIHAVTNRDLLISQLLTPQTLLLPFGVAFVVVQFAFEATWSFIAIASTLTAMAGVVLQPVRRILADWNFRLAHQDDALRLRGGLLETRSQTVPLNRLQAVGATWPLLWRGKRWLRLRAHVAGIAAPNAGDDAGGGRLLPVGDPETARRVLAEALPGVTLDGIEFTPTPRRARWLHPIEWRVLGAGMTDQVVAHRQGVLTRQVLVVPFARIQSVRVHRGPLQRRLGLATVYADTAGGPSVAARDRDLNEAWALAATLAERSRAARSVPAAH